MPRWSVDMIRGKSSYHLGTVEAPDQQAAYQAAIDKFEIPVERQNRLFVAKLDDKR